MATVEEIMTAPGYLMYNPFRGGSGEKCATYTDLVLCGFFLRYPVNIAERKRRCVICERHLWESDFETFDAICKDCGEEIDKDNPYIRR